MTPARLFALRRGDLHELGSDRLRGTSHPQKDVPVIRAGFDRRRSGCPVKKPGRAELR